jgi:hypothetical protein
VLSEAVQNGGVAATTTYPRLLRLSALAASAMLVLTACGGGGDEDDRATEVSPVPTPTPSTTVEVPENVDVTAPGTSLTFGDTATVTHEVKKQGTVLDLTVESAQQGALADFSGFDLDDPYKKKGNYFYVRVSVSNAGDERVSGLPVPLWGVSGKNTLLQAVEFKSSFKKCPTQPLPKNFGPGDEFETCLVYLSPDRGSLEGVSYRPTEDYVPIEWTGKVTTLPSQKDGQKKGQKNKDPNEQ